MKADLVAKLSSLEKTKNDGRGVQCVRDLLKALQRDRREAEAIISNEWDKIRSYSDIAQVCRELFPSTVPKFVCPHDGTVNIPGFFDLTVQQQSRSMQFVKCLCNMTGWWTRIQLSEYHRQDYPGFRCDDCKRLIVVNPFYAQVREIKIWSSEHK